MKIVEALKAIKHARTKIIDLKNRINLISAYMESQASDYDGSQARVNEYMQSIFDTQRNIEKWLTAIQRTNLVTNVTIDIDGVSVTKTIAEWIIRRREGIEQEMMLLQSLTDRGLKSGTVKNADGELVIDRLVRNFDPAKRDHRLMVLSEEASLIDSALEIVNATTDLIEA